MAEDKNQNKGFQEELIRRQPKQDEFGGTQDFKKAQSEFEATGSFRKPKEQPEQQNVQQDTVQEPVKKTKQEPQTDKVDAAKKTVQEPEKMQEKAPKPTPDEKQKNVDSSVIRQEVINEYNSRGIKTPSQEKVAEFTDNIKKGLQSGFYRDIDDARGDIKTTISAGLDRENLLNNIINNEDIDASIKQTEEYQSALEDYQNISKFRGMGAEVIAEAIGNGDIIKGGVLYNRLEELGMQDVLSSAEALNTVNESYTGKLAAQAKEIMGKMEEQKDRDEMYKELMENDRIKESRNEVLNKEKELKDIQDQIDRVEDDVTKELSGTGATKSYKQALVSQRTKDLSRRYKSIKNEYDAVFSRYEYNTKSAQNEYETRIAQRNENFKKMSNLLPYLEKYDDLKSEIESATGTVSEIGATIGGLNDIERWEGRAKELAATGLSQDNIKSTLMFEMRDARLKAGGEDILKGTENTYEDTEVVAVPNGQKQLIDKTTGKVIETYGTPKNNRNLVFRTEEDQYGNKKTVAFDKNTGRQVSLHKTDKGDYSGTDFATAFGTVESGNDYTEINPHSGALGKYQIMPYHLNKIGMNGESAEDRQKFINDPDKQDQLFNKIIESNVAKYGGNLDRAIAAYYGGSYGADVVNTANGDVPHNDEGKQDPNGRYPSVNSYVDKVKTALGKTTTFNEREIKKFTQDDFEPQSAYEDMRYSQFLEANKMSIEVEEKYQLVLSMLPQKMKDGEQEKFEIKQVTKKLHKKGWSKYEILDLRAGYRIDDPENKEFAENVRRATYGIEEYDPSRLGRLINQGDLQTAVIVAENDVLEMAYEKEGNNLTITQSKAADAVKKARKLQNSYYEFLKYEDKAVREGNLSSQDATGPIEGRIKSLEKVFSGNEKVQDLQSKITSSVAGMRNDLLGSAVTENEEKFLAPLIPSINDQGENFIQKVEELRQKPFQEINTLRRQYGLPVLTGETMLINTSQRLSLYKDVPSKTGSYPEAGQTKAKFKEKEPSNPLQIFKSGGQLSSPTTEHQKEKQQFFEAWDAVK